MPTDNYWLSLAYYDLQTAEAMLQSKRYLYVGFRCHQTIEKALKAIYAQNNNEVPPKIHNLARLLKLVELEDDIPHDLFNVIHELNPLNVASRYPDEDLAILKELTPEYTREILNNTKELFEWLLTKM